MSTIMTKDGVEIFYKDWGKGQPIVFSHGWPLSADDWDAQMLFFLKHGYRVIAHDRRGHGRSAQVSDGHDMDHYADDLAALTTHLDLKNAIHVGHSTGGGEVAHYLGRHGGVAAAVLISAVPPIMVKTPANPGGLPIEVFDGLRKALADNRAQFYLDFASAPFYGFNRPGVKPIPGVIQNWWRQAMMGSTKAHYDGIKAFSETDFTDDLKKITVPVLVMHGDDDQIVPYAELRAIVGQAAKERDAKDLQGLPARLPDHAGRHDKCRPAGLPTFRTCGQDRSVAVTESRGETIRLLSALAPSPFEECGRPPWMKPRSLVGCLREFLFPIRRSLTGRSNMPGRNVNPTCSTMLSALGSLRHELDSFRTLSTMRRSSPSEPCCMTSRSMKASPGRAASKWKAPI